MNRLIFLLFLSIFSFSQNESPVSWSFNATPIEEGVYVIEAIAKIDPGWRMYSQYKDADSFINPTAFYFSDSEIEGVDFLNNNIERIYGFPFIDINGNDIEGNRVFFKESKAEEKWDPIFEINSKYFQDEAKFSAKIALEKSITEINGICEFMVCDDKACIFPEPVNFTLPLEGFKPILGCLDKGAVNYNSEANTDNGLCEYPDASCENDLKRNIIGLELEEGEGSILGALITGIIAGLIALITPCVFPMIPLTVSFFLKGSDNRRKAIFRASFYGLCIVLIYFLLSLPFHFFQVDAGILNTIATDPWLNIVFFFIFLVFALSFFGYFEIRLPSKFINKVDSASEIGGMLGIFFMALTLALVSFSCTGPVLGTALAKTGLSSSGSDVAIQLSASMVGFGLALGIPFALFAMFPSLLNSLPKSGGWMNTFKVFIGFIEIALAIKFLSNADVVNEFGLFNLDIIYIHRETFFALWAVTFFFLALYLIGGIYFPHDNPKQKIGYIRLTSGFLVLSFVIYLIPGATCVKNGPNYSLFGLPPPKATHSLCEKSGSCIDCNESNEVFDTSSKKIHLYDYFTALNISRELNKPILVDFTGMACVNCRLLEDNVWTKDSVADLLSQFIVTSLYVDKRTAINNPIRVYECDSKGDVFQSKKIDNIGDKWMYFQQKTFMKNSQPLHVILYPSNVDYNSEELCLDTLGNYIQPVAYSDAKNVNNYYDFLYQGLKHYNTQLNNEIQRDWHSNGQVKWEGEYNNGMKDGVWRYYDENGRLIKEEKYNDGYKLN